MLTTTINHTGPRARSIHVRAVATRVLITTSGASLSQARHGQQSRSFGCGPWSSFFHPELQQGLRRRHRLLRYKSAELMNRRLSWDQHPGAGSVRVVIKRTSGRPWQHAHGRRGGRFANAEFEPIYHHLRDRNLHRAWSSYRNVRAAPKPSLWSDFESWTTQLNDMVNQWTKSGGIMSSASFSSSAPRRDAKSDPTPISDAKMATMSAEEEYVIDPISNRKVLKKSYGSTEAFEISKMPEQSQVQLETDDEVPPTFSDGPPPLDELNKYHSAALNTVTEEETQPESTTNLAAHSTSTDSSGLYNQEYALNHLPPDEIAERVAELDQYAEVKTDEIVEPATELEHGYDDLHKYQPTKHDSISEEETPVAPYEDLHHYKPVKDPKILDATNVLSPEADELDRYRAYDHDKSESDAAVVSEQEYEDLHKYSPRKFDDIEELEKDEPFKEYGDLEQYKAFRFREAHGEVPVTHHDPVAKSLGDYDARAKAREVLETSPNSHSAASTAADEEASASISRNRQTRQIPDGKSSTPKFTSYRKLDTSEQQFEKSWSHVASWSPDGEDQTGTLAQSVKLEKGEGAGERGSSKLEPAMNRNTRSMSTFERRGTVESDPYSKTAQGLETSYLEECGSESNGPSYVRSYGSVPGKDDAPEASQVTGLEELLADPPTGQADTTPSAFDPSAARAGIPSDGPTTIYKVLAYDATMQRIDIAETTSVVSDQASPLTPAEVLLRLSNPTKFFPHFAPLKAQGFEIVSGSGDVLVFRKVREATSSTESNTNIEVPPPKETQPPPPRVNPIDMMGSVPSPPLPNAAAFASPTGFLNYDYARQIRDDPPFQSNIDVRREEPVFSGAKVPDEVTTARPKRSVLRRMLLGGVWVAGISYALGVVGEYFVTGGLDGLGPKGF